MDPIRHLVFSHLDVSETARRTLDPGVIWWGWHLPPAFEAGMVLLLGLAMMGVAIPAVLADGVNAGRRIGRLLATTGRRSTRLPDPRDAA